MVAMTPKPVAKLLVKSRTVKSVSPAPAIAAPPDLTSLVPAPSEKPGKVKMVRDDYSMPKPEYQVLEQLKLRAGQLGTPIKKSELIRAGIKALATLGDKGFLAALATVPPVNNGRAPKP